MKKGEYLRIMIDGKHQMVHRVIWKLVTGEEPNQVDHVNGIRADNRIENLRSVSFAINLKNKALYRNNKHGVPGVGYHKRDKVWTAKIGIGGKQLTLGSFATKDEAVAAILAGHVILDYHPKHGRKA